ncbi:hypothetical protein GCM10009117_21330 [Gangjinia marincola]|uniref:Uncharacterized protein n=1 Tax=Gangjinia marincola TaxID=578463 RepID=A0ABN1MIJ2_9FLAO
MSKLVSGREVHGRYIEKLKSELENNRGAAQRLMNNGDVLKKLLKKLETANEDSRSKQVLVL